MIDVEHDCSLLVEWFPDNYLILNADRCHLLLSSHKYEAIYASLGDALSREENSVKYPWFLEIQSSYIKFKIKMQKVTIT